MSAESRPVFVSTAERPRVTWDDPVRGMLSFFTLFSGEITPTNAMSAGIAEIAPGGSLKPHRHAQAEIYFVFAGTGVMIIDNVETTVAAGTAVFIPGDAEHGIRNESSFDLRLFYVFPTDRFDEVVYRFPDVPVA